MDGYLRLFILFSIHSILFIFFFSVIIICPFLSLFQMHELNPILMMQDILYTVDDSSNTK